MAKDDQFNVKQFGTLSMSKSTEQNDKPTRVQALELAKLLLGCFRHGDVDDPLVFATAKGETITLAPKGSTPAAVKLY